MDEIVKAMKQARSTLEIEGLYIPNEQGKLIEQLLRREISEPVFFKRVLEIVKK